MKEGRFYRESFIKEVDPTMLIETKKKKLSRKHVAWFGSDVLTFWNETCNAMNGFPSARYEKTSDDAVELKLATGHEDLLREFGETGLIPVKRSVGISCPSGRVVKFLGRDACELENFDGVVSMVHSHDREGKVVITALYEDGTKIEVNPNSLNAFIDEMNPRRSCNEETDTCYFEI